MWYVPVPCVSKITIKNQVCFLHFGAAMHLNFSSDTHIVKWLFKTKLVIELLTTLPDTCSHILHFTAATHFDNFWRVLSLKYLITSSSSQNLTVLEWHLAVTFVKWLCWKKAFLRVYDCCYTSHTDVQKALFRHFSEKSVYQRFSMMKQSDETIAIVLNFFGSKELNIDSSMKGLHWAQFKGTIFCVHSTIKNIFPRERKKHHNFHSNKGINMKRRNEQTFLLLFTRTKLNLTPIHTLFACNLHNNVRMIICQILENIIYRISWLITFITTFRYNNAKIKTCNAAEEKNDSHASSGCWNHHCVHSIM